jgi:hypothetical protein
MTGPGIKGPTLVCDLDIRREGRASHWNWRVQLNDVRPEYGCVPIRARQGVSCDRLGLPKHAWAHGGGRRVARLSKASETGKTGQAIHKPGAEGSLLEGRESAKILAGWRETYLVPLGK